MKNKSEKPTPVLLGADLNAYSVAVAFHEAYGVKSYAMGRYKCGLTQFSRIVKIQFCSGYQDIEVFLPELFSFTKKHRGEFLVLVPCADCYVEFVSRHRKELSRYFHFLVPEIGKIEELCNKEKFYQKLKKYGIPYPEFEALTPSDYERRVLEFSYPAVLKPAVSAEYWRHPFPDMRKVYFPIDAKEALEFAEGIFKSGYPESVILQREIRNPEIFVYTVLITDDESLDFGVFGKVVLEECGATSSGNHSAIITRAENELCKRLREFLKAENYRGLANFDILFSNGSFYVLELNARQGRSCDHIRAAGINIARSLLLAIGKEKNRELKLFERDKPYREVFWHYPKKSVAMRYMENADDKKAARELSRRGEDFSALEYLPDLVFNPIRALYCEVHQARLAKAFWRDFSEKRDYGKKPAKRHFRRKRRASEA